MVEPKFSSILFCPLARTGNPAAYRHLIDLAQTYDSKVELFGVIAEPTRIHRVLQASGLEGQVQEAERATILKTLEELRIIDADIEVTTAVEIGKRAVAIIEHVLIGGHDLVVVTTDEDDADQATIRRLLRKCPCPVWVIRQTRPRVQRILAAVNPDPAEEQLNLSILDHAMAMHAVYGGELHVVHAWELYGESTMRHSAFMYMDERAVDAMVEEERAERAALLDTLIGQAGIDEDISRRHLVKGQPAQIIPTLIERFRINLLVMGTIGRGGLSGLVVGNTADNVLDEVRCSVIAVKPPGYISPIPIPQR